MPVSQSLLKIPLEARPDRVVLVGERHAEAGQAPPVDARVAGQALGSVLRSLEDADARRVHYALGILKGQLGLHKDALGHFRGLGL